MLRRRSRALATAVAIALVLAVAALIGHDGAGAAPAKAPAPTVPAAKSQIVVFVPHADDDALSMGVFIQAQLRAGTDVRVVYYTDGAGTGACGVVDGKCTNASPKTVRYYGDTMAEFIAYRDKEFEKAVGALAVGDAEKQHLTTEIYQPVGRPRLHDGMVTVPDMTTMLTKYNALYPAATFFTMSWLDHHQDHRSAGIALRQLVVAGKIARDRALFTMARWYWAYAYPDRTAELTSDGYYQRTSQGFPVAVQMMSCVGDDDCKARLAASLDAYGPCPDDQTTQEQCTDIGFTSVPDFLTVAKSDPRIIIHSVDAAKYPTRMAIAGVARRPGKTTRTTVTGRVVVPDYGRYGTDPEDAANAQYLVQTVVSKDANRTFDKGSNATVTALDARRRPLSVTKLPLSGSGEFKGSVPIPAAATSLSVYSDATQGALPATTVLPVQVQRVQFLRHAKSITVRGTTVTGHYGQGVPLRTRPTVAGRPQRGLATALRLGTTVVSHSGTGRTGYASLVGTLTRSGTWLLATSAPRGTVPALAAAIRTKVAPAVLKVRPKATGVRVHNKHVTVAGTVAGRNYRIAKAYLVPVTVRLYRVGKSGKATYAGSVRTARGGAFTTTIPARKGEKITFRVAGLAHIFSAVKNAGTVKVK